MTSSFPKKMDGRAFFTHVIPEFLPEYDPKKLATLGLIIQKKGKNKFYQPLKDSLRKIQWVKLVGAKAIFIEKDIAKAQKPNALLLDPLRQTAHSLCVTDCLIHSKSALDSMAVFLTDLLGLEQKAGDRDFKKLGFRQSICRKDAFLKRVIKKLEPWFLELQGIRDKWIHINAVESTLVQGKSEVGMLPIPRKIDLSMKEQKKIPIDSKNYWSTKDFVNHHYSNLATLFLSIIDRSLQIERLDLNEPITLPKDFSGLFAIFPTHLTEDMLLKKIRVRTSKSLVEW